MRRKENTLSFFVQFQHTQIHILSNCAENARQKGLGYPGSFEADDEAFILFQSSLNLLADLLVAWPTHQGEGSGF